MSEKNIKMVIVVNRALNMRKGKMCAQAAHAAMGFLLDNNIAKKSTQLHVELSDIETEWLNDGHAKIVVGCDSEPQLRDLMLKARLADIQVHEVIDAGRTEFHGEPTLTCCAFGPDHDHVLDKITGNLKLL